MCNHIQILCTVVRVWKVMVQVFNMLCTTIIMVNRDLAD